jgi:hypothetical protein
MATHMLACQYRLVCIAGTCCKRQVIGGALLILGGYSLVSPVATGRQLMV